MAKFCSDRWTETHSNQLTREYGDLADYWKELKILKGDEEGMPLLWCLPALSRANYFYFPIDSTEEIWYNSYSTLMLSSDKARL